MMRALYRGKKEYYYNIHGLLKIKSNFINYIPNYFLVDEKLENVDIILELVKNIEIPSYDYLQIAPGLFYSIKQDSVISKFQILGFNFSWEIKGLLKDPTIVYFTNAYKNFVLMPVSTVYPINDYIKFILHLKLLFKGYGFLIGACFKPENKDYAVIISSCGGMGKTSTLLNLFKEIKGKYYSDDTLIVSKDKVYSYPTDISVRKFGFTILHYITHTPVTRYFSRKEIGGGSVLVNKFFFLEKGSKNEIIKIDSSDGVRKILAINRKIIPYNMERSILAYFYYNHLFDLYGVMRREEEMIKALFSNLSCYVLKCKEPKYWNKMLYDILREEN